VKAALAALPLEQRAAVTLCLVSGFSHSEAAKILGAALGTVKSHVLRGSERLREAMEKKT
jgi:RNA polymerase sigma-70 factor (ECF subfamily)